jgi:hypothetical protein
VVLAMIPSRWAEAVVAAPIAASPPPDVEPPPPIVDPSLRNVPSVVDAERLVWKGGPDFYRAIWRDDLAASYERRHAFKLTSRILGATAFLAGSLVTMAASLGCGADWGSGFDGPRGPGCGDQKLGAIGGLTMLGGLVALIAPSFFDTDPANPHERYDLLVDFERREKARRLSLAPSVDRNGAGLMLSAQF